MLNRHFLVPNGTMRCPNYVAPGCLLLVPTLWELNGSILSWVACLFRRLLTQAKVCFIFSRHYVGYCASMSLFMCGSKGMRLVISSSYHTNISYILNPLSYNIMYPSWFATTYSCPFFMVSMWSYHWWSKYPFASMSLWEWVYNNPWHSSKYCRNYYFRKWSTCLEGCFPPFPCHIWQWMDILITKDGFQTLMDGCHFFLDSHKYDATNIDDDNTCNDDYCFKEDRILHQTNIGQWLHSPCWGRCTLRWLKNWKSKSW